MPGPDLDRIAAASARTLLSVATVGVADHHIEIFGVTARGALRHRWHQGSWSPWTGMQIPRGAQAIHVGAGAHGRWLDLFVVTTSGRLLHRWWGEFDGWSTWNDWGGDFMGPVSVASINEYQNEVFVHRRGKLVHKWLTGNTWSDWHDFT